MIAILLSSACTKEFVSKDLKLEETITSLTQKTAERQFAEILSKAVSENEDIRYFLKTEALKQFDNDYDVFYPFIKNVIVANNKTFRDLIIPYAKNEEQLIEIEVTVPKLTILIPDFSWVSKDCFNVRNWNTSSGNIAVGYDDGLYNHPIFYNGILLGEMPSDAFPEFPVLIVKSNERMKISHNTKSGMPEFDFIDKIFDGTKRNETKGGMWGYGEWDMYNENKPFDLVNNIDNFISAEELNAISPETIRAYEEFGLGWNNGIQRDYILYGMSKTNTNNGHLNPFRRELLYRFCLTPEGIKSIADDYRDPNIKNALHTGRDDRPGFNNALRRLWGDGNFEIKLEFFQNSKEGGSGFIGSINLSIRPHEAMYIKKLHRTFQWNFFGNNWSSYSISSIDDIEPKWYYPGDRGGALSIINTTWNLSNVSDNIWIKISEFDEESITTEEKSQSFKHSSSVQANASGTLKKIGLGVSGSYGEEKSVTSHFKYQVNHGADDMGDCFLEYADNIVTNKGIFTKGAGYKLKVLGSDWCTFSFIPIDIRNEDRLIEYLYKRKERIKNE